MLLRMTSTYTGTCTCTHLSGEKEDVGVVVEEREHDAAGRVDLARLHRLRHVVLKTSDVTTCCSKNK